MAGGEADCECTFVPGFARADLALVSGARVQRTGRIDYHSVYWEELNG